MTFSTLGTDLQTGEVVQIARSSRLQGVYIIGSPHTGKSGLLENLIMQDIEQGIGLCLLDPHGTITKHILASLPLNRKTDVILREARTAVYMRQVMDEGKILLVKPDSQVEVGSPIIAEILNTAYSRAHTPSNKRMQFHLYADEFQRFSTEDFAILLTEARKFGIGITIAHQYRRQLDGKNRDASLTAANLIVFRVSGEDGQEMVRQFDTTPIPEYKAQSKQQLTHADMASKIANELTSLPNFVARVRIAEGETPVECTIHTLKPA